MCWRLPSKISARPSSSCVDQVRPLVVSGRRAEARKLLQATEQPDCRDVVDALIAALSADS